MTDDQHTSESLEALREEKRQQESQRTTLGLIGLFVFLCAMATTIMYFMGDPLGVLQSIGIDPPTQSRIGAEVDCTKRKNRLSPFCRSQLKK